MYSVTIKREESHPMNMKKVGGIHFIRVGRFQLSFCKVRPKPRTFSQSTYHVGAHVIETWRDGEVQLQPRFGGVRFI